MGDTRCRVPLIRGRSEPDWHYSADALQKILRFPIAIRFVGADLEICFPGRMLFHLDREPMEPFERFLRTSTATLFFDVGPQFPPGQTNRAADEVSDDAQRNDSRIN
jgi:hypothetical protein